jgi:hypothetical protein
MGKLETTEDIIEYFKGPKPKGKAKPKNKQNGAENEQKKGKKATK